MIKVVVGSFLLLGFIVNAQEFQGKAEYFSKRIIKEKVEVLLNFVPFVRVDAIVHCLAFNRSLNDSD